MRSMKHAILLFLLGAMIHILWSIYPSKERKWALSKLKKHGTYLILLLLFLFFMLAAAVQYSSVSLF